MALPAGADDYLNKRVLRKLETGLICPARNAEKIPAPGTALGHVRRSQASEEIVYSTRTVPMVRNLGFGFNLRPLGPRVLDPVTVTITHPPYANNDVTVESWQADIRPFRSNLNYFVFEFDEEMVPGVWTFEVQYEGEKLLSVSFDVVAPEDFPNVAQLCNGALLS